MVVGYAKFYHQMKNKNQLSIEENIVKQKKMPAA